jgi:hypothetical protein
MTIGSLEGFTIEPHSRNLALFRRASEPRHAYEVEITSRRIALLQVRPDKIAGANATADAKRYVPALRKAARQFQRETFANRSRRAAGSTSGCGEPQALAIRDDIKRAFKALIEQSDVQEKATERERKRTAKARQVFENEFKRVTDQIIVPTLAEIGSLLQRSGWTCSTTPLSSELGIRFEVSRGTTTKAIGETGRSHIAFACLSERLRLGIVSFGHTSGGGRHEYALGDVSNDFVAQQVLLFFRRLTTENPPPCAAYSASATTT